MPSHKPGYLISLILLAIVCSAPAVLICGAIGIYVYQTGNSPLKQIPGVLSSPIGAGSRWFYVPLWRDEFVEIDTKWENGAKRDLSLMAHDVETGEIHRWRDKPQFTGDLLTFGDRLFLLPHQPNGKSYEIVEGSFHETRFHPPLSPSSPRNLTKFLWNGQPTYLNPFRKNFDLVTFDGRQWVKGPTLNLPSQDQVWQFNETQIYYRPERTTIRCFNRSDDLHLFLFVDGHLFYRRGLDLKATEANSSDADTVTSAGDGEAIPAAPPSAFDPRQAGWSLIRYSVMKSDPSPDSPLDGAMFIAGDVGIFIVDTNSVGELIGTIYRFNGTVWSQFATLPLPFGSRMFKALPASDGKTSYLLVGTLLGQTNFYRVDSQGIHFLRSESVMPLKHLLTEYSIFTGVCLVSETLLALGVWFLMWRCTNPTYMFGQQTIRLASVGQRGLARLIDFGFIAVVVAGTGWMAARDLEWLPMWDAINLRMDHPSIAIARRAILFMAITLVVVVLAFLHIQGRTGLSPGKWCCGLRTLRATLRPCGFIRSLTREILMCIDTCNLICATPGILSIALTSCRQRLGDIVADTIVVQVGSIKNPNK